ncbi:MAG: PEP-CTERM sorting domain-containing protein [Planctomycetota bacterium]|nr:PEP-CTERM sorting domain-containing protein [Planctomycetota bacterium]
MAPISGKRLILVAVALMLGFSAVPALAAPFLYYDLRTATGESTVTLDALHPMVSLSLYVWVKNGDGIAANDRWSYSTGQIKSSDSSVDVAHKLLGDLSAAGIVWAAGLDALSKTGTTGATQDGDTDIDIGNSASWFTGTVGTVSSYTMVNTPLLAEETIGGTVYEKFLIASGITFTYTGTPDKDASTVIQYYPRAAAATQKCYSDTTFKSLRGDTVADVSTLGGVTVSFVPEPATMALLAAGGLVALVRRRRTA